MPYCRSCGAVVGADEQACRNCGAPQMVQAPPPPPPPAYSYPPHQEIHVTQHGPLTAIGWIVLILLILIVVAPLAAILCLGYSCAQITIVIPLGIYLWKWWTIRRAGL